MKLENQVCSLELSKRLKELLVKQESLFYMHPILGTIIYSPNAPVFHPESKTIWVSAFTVAELGEMLPKELISDDKFHPYELNCKWELHYSDNKMWHITYKKYTGNESKDFIIYDENEADARAKMLIYLLENKLMELTNET